MEYMIEFKQVDAIPTAVVRRQAKRAELSKVVPQACGEVWTALKENHVAGAGRLVAVYFDGVMNLEIGAEVPESFSATASLIRSETPKGWVLTTTHFGPYDQLPGAYDALNQYCASESHSSTGVYWEIYGHWDSDPSKLRTDVFCQVTHKAGS